MAHQKYEAGDFIMTALPDSFYIYEGKMRLNPNTNVMRYTLLAYYNPKKYIRDKDGWVTIDFLDVATKDKEVEFDILVDHEDYSYHICNDEEKARCIQILKEHGYEWDDENKCVIKIGSEDEPYKPKLPNYTYNGEVVMTSNKDKRKLLDEYVKNKVKPMTPQYSQSNMYARQQNTPQHPLQQVPCYGDDWDGYDYYNDY